MAKYDNSMGDYEGGSVSPIVNPTHPLLDWLGKKFGKKPQANFAEAKELDTLWGMYQEEQGRGAEVGEFEEYVKKMGYNVDPQVWSVWEDTRK